MQPKRDVKRCDKRNLCFIVWRTAFDMADLEPGPGWEPADPILSSFVKWFEEQDIGAQFDTFISAHAHMFKGASPSTEQSLEWQEIYLQYQALFDDKLQSFVEQAGTTVEAFLASAQAADGLHEAYLQIFLAHAEYDTFIELMAEEAEKQSS